MNTSSWVVFKNLLNQKSSGSQLAVDRFLTKEMSEKLKSAPCCTKNPFSSPASVKDCLNQIHYSWLIPFLEPFAENDKAKILSVFDMPQSNRLKTHFKMTDVTPSLTKVGDSYLTLAIYDWLTLNQKEFLPLEFLPDHPLNKTLDLSKKELQTLVDYLGLHDLSTELKQVITSKQIKKIQTIFPKEKEEYLKSLLKTKEPLSFPRLNLDHWNGDGEKLKIILHHRGFNRLAKALFGCHPSLLWHVCHRLDTGRAKILRKFFTDINNDEAQQVLIKQILDLIPKVHKRS